MKKITALSILLVCLTIQQSMHAYYFSPDELGGGNPALSEAMANEPGKVLLIVCCPCYSLCGLGLLTCALEKAPSYDRVRTAIAAYDCCRRLEETRMNFIEAHNNGLLALLKPHSEVKSIKMKDE